MAVTLDPINVGQSPDDKTGDSDRTAWIRQNGMNAAFAAAINQNSNSLASLTSSTSLSTALQQSANLSDLSNAVAARANLGLGNVSNLTPANYPVSTAQAAADTTVQNNAATDATTKANAAQANAISTAQGSSLQKSANLSDLAAVTTARANLGLGTSATYNPADLPVSTAQQTALNGKVNRAYREILDAAATIATADVYVAMKTLTAARTLTLPAASAYTAGQPLWVADHSGSCSGTLTITIAAAGADTIAGKASITMGSAYQKLTLHSNGANLWTF